MGLSGEEVHERQIGAGGRPKVASRLANSAVPAGGARSASHQTPKSGDVRRRKKNGHRAERDLLTQSAQKLLSRKWLPWPYRWVGSRGSGSKILRRELCAAARQLLTAVRGMRLGRVSCFCNRRPCRGRGTRGSPGFWLLIYYPSAKSCCDFPWCVRGHHSLPFPLSPAVCTSRKAAQCPCVPPMLISMLVVELAFTLSFCRYVNGAPMRPGAGRSQGALPSRYFHRPMGGGASLCPAAYIQPSVSGLVVKICGRSGGEKWQPGRFSRCDLPPSALAAIGTASGRSRWRVPIPIGNAALACWTLEKSGGGDVFGPGGRNKVEDRPGRCVL